MQVTFVRQLYHYNKIRINVKKKFFRSPIFAQRAEMTGILPRREQGKAEGAKPLRFSRQRILETRLSTV